MKRFRPDRDHIPARAALTVLALAGGCHIPAAVSATGRHPTELVGSWIDSAKTTAGDTALWILGSSGEDAAQHLLRDTVDGAPFVVTAKRHYGYWYLDGALSTAAHRAICFTNRPGRSAPSCARFDLDSASNGMVVRRRLVIHGYRGEQHVGDRVLLERVP